MALFSKLFKSYSEKEVDRIRLVEKKVLDLEEKYGKMSDKELKQQTPNFKFRLRKGETLDDILPEAFAVLREAMYRVLGKKPYPVQVLGGIVLHQGRIAEMRTGEGKTIVAALPSYLNALSGDGVHVVTCNEFLAWTACEQIGRVHKFLGLTVGLIAHENSNDERRESYACDITYATNNELGFDYLRDNMVTHKEERVQRIPNYAIVDEVDSILIDEARTPLVISGKGDKSTDMYKIANDLAKKLKPVVLVELDKKEEIDDYDGDYIVDEKGRTATLLPAGVVKAEKHFDIENLMDAENITILHHVNKAIQAHGTMHRDQHYVIKDGEVVIVDESTGRLMDGRRYNEGLHQAIEAKEGVDIKHESKTLASITFQNFFRLYKKLSGMTGTGMTEENEFRQIYKLDVIEVPTNRPVIRIDHNDRIYSTKRGKINAAIEQIKLCHEKGQPVLVGTTTIEGSEELSKYLTRNGIKHQVLNAKNHARESDIVAQAGKFGSVTIATNMAGRGTDILLGGNAEYLAKAEMRRRGLEEGVIEEATGFADTEDEEVMTARTLFKELEKEYSVKIEPERVKVKEAGGLYVLGTERHESRRIDNQLRGRAGRQGDVGESCFFISLDDDLMRIFGGDRLKSIMSTLSVEEDTPIESVLLTKTIQSAQKKVEARNFQQRKSVLDFDDVMSKQRETIYKQRGMVLDGENISESIKQMMEQTVDDAVDAYLVDELSDNWNFIGLRESFIGVITNHDDFRYTTEEMEKLTKEDVRVMLQERVKELYAAKEAEFGEEMMREVERAVLLRNVDEKWMDHIVAMDELKQGIHLVSMSQKDPVVEYRHAGFEMFDEMVAMIREDTTRMILATKLRIASDPQQQVPQRKRVMNPYAPNEGSARVQGGQVPASKGSGVTVRKIKIGPNSPCPCGSGKKYKNCCGG